ncbi:MAG: hypothetical protein CR982_00345 [Candidatus Cloacimonadota bacterium]|nr:MAG: hypothetical protein CR982_00345 [Candidatus Cloacimonadota bacterium]PIE78750.1 MAG: hypothetical protein CSA15_06105 [Candidatus Delongbacteria bacterium]
MEKIPNENWEIPKLDRRNGPDYIKMANFWVGVVCWFIFAVSIIIVFKSMPEDQTILSRVRGTIVRNYWNLDLLKFNIPVVFALLIFSFIGILINRARMRRKSDRYNKFLVFAFFYSVFSMVFNSIIIS